MERLIHKYARKLVDAGLAASGAPLVAGLDADLIWNRKDPATSILEPVFDGLNINSLLFAEPTEPYRSIINYLAGEADGAIYPNDSESRTFLHDLPVVSEFTSVAIVEALSHRKSVIIPGEGGEGGGGGEGIVTFGTVSPEQAFVSFSSVCFACFVKFFADYLADSRNGSLGDRQKSIFETVLSFLEPLPETFPKLADGPFYSEEDVYKAISEAGRLTVHHRLVDSYFGNVSYLYNGTLYISQTTSSLDELEGFIDPVPLDGSSCAGITASSELTAHREIVQTTGNNAILHGHPKFSVIISMDCDREDCRLRGQCHVKCPEQRFVEDIQIIPGEVGTGPRGLSNTLPPAMQARRGAIVYGHGVFTVGKDDFNLAFRNLIAIEKMCRDEYFKRVAR